MTEPRTLPSPKTPYEVARQVLHTVYVDEAGHLLLAYWRGDWWAYTGTHWQRHAQDATKDGELQIRGELYALCADAVYPSGDSSKMMPWDPNSSRISNVLDALKPLANAVLPDTDNHPCRIGETDRVPGDPTDYVSLQNGLFNWRTGDLIDHAPELFTTYTLPYAFDPHAQAPVWHQFLQDVFAHDPRGALLLQEFAGYVISGRTDLHKGLMIIGPRRAGKGTILRVLTDLLGAHNVATPTLNSLGTDSGQATLIGRPLAVIGDARAADPRNANQVTEFLLNCIGEDGVSIGRKYLSNWTGRLPTRIIVASNEVPRLIDSSGAVVSRFMSVRLVQSYEGKEDSSLGVKLEGELSGILNWALEGLRRLEEQGVFTIPDTMEEMTEHLRSLASPVTQFIEEHLEVTGDPGDMADRSELFHVWEEWNTENGTKATGAEEMCRRLNAADARITYGLREVPGAIPKPGQARPPRKRYVLGVKQLPNF